MPVAELDTGLGAVAEKLSHLAAQHAADADTTRRLAPDVVAGLREAGFARHFVSSRWGGTDGTFTELVGGVLTVSQACASTGWCASLLAASSRFAAHLPEAGHEELWGGGPDAFIATGLVPSGRAQAADGGWRLSGSWSYISGVDFADWVLLCGAVAGEGPPELRFFALPRGSFETVESWDCAGMRATGSHTVVVSGAYVPSHLSFARADMETGRNSWSTQPTHNVPFQASGALTFIGPAVGAAQGALKAAAAGLANKKRFDAAEVELVRASGRIDAARHLVEQNAQVIDARAFTPEFMARNQRNASFSGELVADALTGLLRAAGTAGLTESGPLQRFWRDVTAATSHVALRFDITKAARNYSEALFADA
ncbi:hypothetical protein AMK26_33420 [Streptomyces sp. CB03234]|uniref:hypothetical protein n=1 Tax=Streptomyces sp. (strain CB03234) TaxID=1703937 RepID=UPI00093BF09A|nr:hypothetical protein [Streptomyces sp. CB03234]OKJ94691.1 hypothetical protein AMK26_33420 [Streptomyces sp. CB03234]